MMGGDWRGKQPGKQPGVLKPGGFETRPYRAESMRWQAGGFVYL
jgi:hypothetical protein